MVFGGYSHLSNVLEGPPKVSSCIYLYISKLSMFARVLKSYEYKLYLFAWWLLEAELYLLIQVVPA